jgi:hypothetical protein
MVESWAIEMPSSATPLAGSEGWLAILIGECVFECVVSECVGFGKITSSLQRYKVSVLSTPFLVSYLSSQLLQVVGWWGIAKRLKCNTNAPAAP